MSAVLLPATNGDLLLRAKTDQIEIRIVGQEGRSTSLSWKAGADASSAAQDLADREALFGVRVEGHRTVAWIYRNPENKTARPSGASGFVICRADEVPVSFST